MPIGLKLGIELCYVNETFKAPGYDDVDDSRVDVSADYYF